MRKQLAHNRDALFRRLAFAVNGLGHSLTNRAVVIDQGVADLGKRQATKLRDGVVGRDRAGAHIVNQLLQLALVHNLHCVC